jgi:hypothetical protein
MGISIFPTPEAAGGGLKYELISSIDLSVGTPAAVAFTSIDPKYRSLKLVVDATFSTAARCHLQFNNDSGTNYSWQIRALSGTSNSQVRDFDATYVDTSTTGTDTVQALTFYVNETNVAAVKTGFGNSNFETNAVVANVPDFHWKNTATINEWNILASTGTFTGGNAYLLGSE